LNDRDKRQTEPLTLVSGTRFRLQDVNAFAFLEAGRVEVYAVTRKKTSFRQMFLAELQVGDAAFPSADEFGSIDVLLYAAEDSVIWLRSLDECSAEELVPLMRNWLKSLLNLPWMQLMADRGDDYLITWKDGTVFAGMEHDHQALLEEFIENEQIFAMMLGIRFKAEDEKLSRRLDIREGQKTHLMRDTAATLLGEEITYSDNGSGNKTLDEVSFVVTAVAKALYMSTDNINLSADATKRMDQLAMLRRLVQKSGMQMRLIEMTGKWWTADSGVMIGYYGAKKSLAALVPQKVGQYLLINRQHPEGIPITEEIAKNIDKDAFSCYGGLSGKSLKIRDLLWFMIRQCWKADMVTIILVSVLAGIIPLVTPIITETVFHDIIPILDREGLATVTQVSMITGFTMAALSVVRSISVMRFATHLDIAAEAALWARLLTLPTRFFRQWQTGELANRLQGVDAIKGALAGESSTQLFNFIFSFWSLLLMAYYSIPLTVAALVLWTVYCAVHGLIFYKMLKAQRKLTEAQNKTEGILQEIFTGLAKFRVQGAEEQAYNLWGKRFGEEWKWSYKMRWLGNINDLISSVQPLALSLLLYYIVFYHINTPEATAAGKTTISYATFLAFQSAYAGFNGTLNSVMPAIVRMLAIRPHLDNIVPILQAEPEASEDKLEADILSGAIEVRNLTFAYEKDLPNVLNDVSFRIKAGENVAIVGKSGCGKSTLVRLLLGFETPKSGAVYYDGQDMAELALSSVRTQMGVVLQNGQLLPGDIFSNIVGTSRYTQDDAWAAAEAAGVAEDIRQMPMGMQTVISEGSGNISGGQRQRILIARALVGHPAIVIFDEATSALDNRTQSIVTDSLSRMHATRIVVAHRLSTIRNADRILVMDAGGIAESGTYDELVKRGGLFASLVKRQVA